MGWRLFLDDDADHARRPSITVENPAWRSRMALPATPPEVGHFGEWKIARSFAEAVSLVSELGMPTYVSFDHDLGDGKDGIAFARFLVEHDLDRGGLPDAFAFEVHSANPVGRENIRGLLDGYLASRKAAVVSDPC